MSDTALLIIDMFNDYQHEDGDELAKNVAEILDPLQRLLTAARAHAGVEVIVDSARCLPPQCETAGVAAR